MWLRLQLPKELENQGSQLLLRIQSWLEVIRGRKREGVRRKSRVRGNQEGGEEVGRLLGRVEDKEDGKFPFVNLSSSGEHFLQ